MPRPFRFGVQLSSLPGADVRRARAPHRGARLLDRLLARPLRHRSYEPVAALAAAAAVTSDAPRRLARLRRRLPPPGRARQGRGDDPAPLGRPPRVRPRRRLDAERLRPGRAWRYDRAGRPHRAARRGADHHPLDVERGQDELRRPTLPRDGRAAARSSRRRRRRPRSWSAAAGARCSASPGATRTSSASTRRSRRAACCPPRSTTSRRNACARRSAGCARRREQAGRDFGAHRAPVADLRHRGHRRSAADPRGGLEADGPRGRRRRRLRRLPDRLGRRDPRPPREAPRGDRASATS